MLRWHVQLGNIVIPKSAPRRMRENIDVFGFELSTDDLAAMDALGIGNGSGPTPTTWADRQPARGRSRVHADRERAAMVDRACTSAGSADSRVLAAMGEVPRERFVPTALVADAYADHPLDIGLGQTISAPWIVAFCVAALDVPPDGSRAGGRHRLWLRRRRARPLLPSRADHRAAPAARRAGPGHP